MATSEQVIGRREGIGLGIEATVGTAVAPQYWMRWLSNDFQNKTEVIKNESAMGVVDQINDSEVVAKWAEGTIGGKVTEEGIGYLLTGFFGSPTTGAAVSGIYPHTFVMNQSSIPKALTIGRYMPLGSMQHSYGTIDTFELSNETGGWVEVSCAIKARVGTTATLTPAYTAEAEFTSKHTVVKLAANTAGLGAATALKASSVKLNMERSSTAFNPLGTDDAPEFDRGVFTVAGEVVIRYTDTQYEDAFLANTKQAMSITIANGNKTLAFTLGQVRFRELEKSTDKDDVVTQTLSFEGEYNLSEGRTVQAILNNARATYQSA